MPNVHAQHLNWLVPTAESLTPRMQWPCALSMMQQALLNSSFQHEQNIEPLKPCGLLQEENDDEEGVSLSADGKTLTKAGVAYAVGDYVYLHPETFDQLEQAAQAEVPDYAAKGRFHKVSPSSPSICHVW